MGKNEKKDRIERLKAIVGSMPNKPGSYQFYDDKGEIIYVGKAKNLKARVSSYFLSVVDRYKTKVLVSKIHEITYTVVNTEEDALLLENSLIKKYNPKYNILLKDGKTYPSICITNEPYPRIFKTRTINKKWGSYYGPYSHIATMYALLDIIKKLYRPRTCNQIIKEEDVKAGKYRVCLDYHIKNCGGVCIGKQSREDYLKHIEQARQILKGNTRQLLGTIRTEMDNLAMEMRYEEADELKKKYLLIQNFCAKSEVVSHTINNVDVVGITVDEKKAFINYMHVTQGAINQSFTFEMTKKLEETEEELLALGIVEIRARFGSNSKEIIVPFDIGIEMNEVTLTIPQRGDKKTLLQLSMLNCKQYKLDRMKQSEKLNPEQKQTRLMTELKEKLKMEKMPYHIECFDNSNISGSDAVAACVVFKRLKPSKKEYRKYQIKTVEGPDDYASMQEVVRRRYKRMIEENSPLPDLIITDGGQGQMSVVREVVEDELQLNIPIAGLAKDNKHRTNELLYGFPPQTIAMKTDSELFHVLTHIQDEVHRFAISYHREKRSKHQLHSELDDIKGIGEKTKETLLKKWKSVKRIKEISLDELTKEIGRKKAELIIDYFRSKEQ